MHNDGEITEIKKTYNGQKFFRKIFCRLGCLSINQEKEIIKILMKNPHPNITTYFQLNDKYVDMELLNTNNEDFDIKQISLIMLNVKKFLQNLGIMYIDWKIDNIGKDEHGNYKLFDFDCSGIVSQIEKNKWVLEPAHYYNYNKAIENGFKEPIEIDNFLFDNYFQLDK
jgi:serine/threonine protein kinase